MSMMGTVRRINMRKQFGALIVAGVLAGVGSAAGLIAQTAPVPYKLGMFRQGDRTFVGVVVNDDIVVDLSRTDVKAPATLKELIARWDANMATRVQRIAADAAKSQPAGSARVAQLKTLPPIPDPVTLLSAAVNYQEHAIEMRSGSTTAESAKAVDPKVAQGI